MIVLIGGRYYRECSSDQRRQARTAVANHTLGATTKVNKAALGWVKFMVVQGLLLVTILFCFGLYLLVVQGKKIGGTAVLFVGMTNLAITTLHLWDLIVFRRLVVPKR